MTRNVQKSRADIPRACRGNIRAAFFTLPLVVFFSLALVPLSANVDNSGNVSVQRCEAFAEATPNLYASDFLEALANGMGLSVGDAVATVSGMTASGLGMVIATDAGIKLGETGSKSLGNLADAADYPAWDTLSVEQQQAWGNIDNYNASKFNSLMDAFGLGNARDRFYSSGGSSLELEESEYERVEQLGRIGNLWLNNIGVSIADIKSAFTNPQAVANWFPSSAGGLEFDSEGVQSWPNLFPRYVSYVSQIRELGVIYNSGERWYGLYNASDSVFGAIWKEANEADRSTVRIDMFSKDPFTLQYGARDIPTRATYTAQRWTYNGQTFYYADIPITVTNSGYVGSPDVTVNIGSSQLINSSFNYSYMGAILYNEQNQGSPQSGAEYVPEYPEEIPDDEAVYYPIEGVNPQTVWNDYIQPQRPTNPYNPGNETGTGEWEQETKQNVMPLQNIKFDKLFPFCLMTDVKDLTEKIEQTITPGQQSDYLKIKVPMAYASNDEGQVSEEIELDGTPLRDLLVMVRPFNQILLLFLMVFSLVMFWKSILTGD